MCLLFIRLYSQQDWRIFLNLFLSLFLERLSPYILAMDIVALLCIGKSILPRTLCLPNHTLEVCAMVARGATVPTHRAPLRYKAPPPSNSPRKLNRFCGEDLLWKFWCPISFGSVGLFNIWIIHQLLILFPLSFNKFGWGWKLTPHHTASTFFVVIIIMRVPPSFN